MTLLAARPASRAPARPRPLPLLQRCCCSSTLLVGLGACGWGAVPVVSVPTDSDSFASPAAGSGPFGFLDGIERSNYLLGSMWGLRTALSQVGISVGLQETSEGFGNVTGGTRHGAAYDGLTQLVLQCDTQRAFGWQGGTFQVSGLQLHGRNLSAETLDAFQTISGIEGDRSTRLWECWYQQRFLDEDRADLKLGQQSLDQEFMVSGNSNFFVNTMMGWPMVPSADLPGGGPAYPLSALGVRLRVRPVDAVTVLLGVFNGSPTRHEDGGDPQQEDRHGTTFALNGGVLAILEIQYLYPALGALERPGQAEPLSRSYKIGAWYDSEDFADQRVDDQGLSLADPASDGQPRQHRGDWGLYAVLDQMLWHASSDSDRNLNAFLRVMGTPQADRNLIVFSCNGGLLMHEPILHRDDDIAGLGFGYTHVSSAVSALDENTAAYAGASAPVRHGETFIEATYGYEAMPWWELQPDVQYIIRPGGGVPNPNRPGTTIGNELVLGVRTNILF